MDCPSCYGELVTIHNNVGPVTIHTNGKPVAIHNNGGPVTIHITGGPVKFFTIVDQQPLTSKFKKIC